MDREGYLPQLRRMFTERANTMILDNSLKPKVLPEDLALSLSSSARRRQSIEQQIEEFFARGGEVQEVRQGESGLAMSGTQRARAPQGVVSFVILGEPASKANSREIVKRGNKVASIKSEKARDYEAQAILQIPHDCRVMFDCPVKVSMTIYYATERPDLDESVVLDVLQAKIYNEKDSRGKTISRRVVRRGVYINDRQVREKHIKHSIDKNNPRAEITVEPLFGNDLF